MRGTTYKVGMNRTRKTFKASGPAANRRASGSDAKETEIPEFPHCSGDPSLYVAEIHCRAETVTPVLKEIPGYLPDHENN